MESLYILELAGGKYYVGKTTDIKRRVEQHLTGRGSEWTKLHKPIKVLETRKLKDEHDENNTTKDLMKKYGIDNVRGGSYSQVMLPSAYKSAVTAEVRGNTNTCFGCGKSGHFVKDCPEEESDDEDDTEDDEEESDDESETIGCYRCGREGHWIKDCVAYTSASGDYIGKPTRDFRYDWSDDDSD